MGVHPVCLLASRAAWWVRCWLGCGVGAYLIASAALAATPVTLVTYCAAESALDRRNDYTIAVLKLALDKTRDEYGDYLLQPSLPMNTARARQALLTNSYENFIVKFSYDPELERAGLKRGGFEPDLDITSVAREQGRFREQERQITEALLQAQQRLNVAKAAASQYDAALQLLIKVGGEVERSEAWPQVQGVLRQAQQARDLVGRSAQIERALADAGRDEAQTRSLQAQRSELQQRHQISAQLRGNLGPSRSSRSRPTGSQGQ